MPPDRAQRVGNRLRRFAVADANPKRSPASLTGLPDESAVVVVPGARLGKKSVATVRRSVCAREATIVLPPG